MNVIGGVIGDEQLILTGFSLHRTAAEGPRSDKSLAHGDAPS